LSTDSPFVILVSGFETASQIRLVRPAGSQAASAILAAPMAAWWSVSPTTSDQPGWAMRVKFVQTA
jgi:hypothetical protein